MPLRAAKSTSAASAGCSRRAQATSCSALCGSTRKVCRLRLFTPMMAAPNSSARSISSRSHTSTSACIPSCVQSAYSVRSCSGSSAATISRQASAPCARASYSWYSLSRKSLQSTAGRECGPMRSTWSRTARISFSEPLNQVGSVSTEMAPAPARAYSSACSAAFTFGAIMPRLGEARFTSPRTATRPQRRRRARRSTTGGAAAAAARSCSSGSARRACSTSWRRRAQISSRMVAGWETLLLRATYRSTSCSARPSCTAARASSVPARRLGTAPVAYRATAAFTNTKSSSACCSAAVPSPARAARKRAARSAAVPPHTASSGCACTPKSRSGSTW
mmetsp:Transcript_4778/g.11900  ORF Transcript_4778/g.11900 Transcript_4778/m.11900 type:complete len:335 (-) Transcript_4778:6-1010(-)